MKKALFAGSFNPPTLGHLDIIERAAAHVEKLYIGIAENTDKAHVFLKTADKQDLLKLMTKHLTNVEVIVFKGLASDFVRQHQIDVFIRSLRSSADLDLEMSMASSNRQLCGVDTFLIVGNPKYSHISSTLVREIAAFGGDLKGFVPPVLENKIKEKINK